MIRRFTLGVGMAVAGLLWVTSARGATLAAEYSLEGTYAPSFGTISPLTVVGPSGNASFVTDTVNGQSREVLQLMATATGGLSGETGVQAETDGTITNPADYSVVLLAKFSLSADVAATKVLDFKNLSSDAGLYVNDTTGLLDFNDSPTPAVGGTPVVSGNYVQIVLTRDGTTGATTVYEDGTQAFEFTDTGDLAVLGDTSSMSTADYLTFFKDDASGLGAGVTDETTLGNIADIQLYNGALTPAQVADLVPEPTSVSLLGVAAAIGMLRRRPRPRRRD